MKGINKDDVKEDIEKKISYTELLVTPEIFEYTMNPFKDEFLIIGSDGLFKTMKSQEVVDFVWKWLIKKQMYEIDVNHITNELVNEVIINRGEKDDVTCILVLLQWSLNSN